MHIILLRGLARETGHWLNFPSTLCEQLGSDCQVHCIDFPGCGEHHAARALESVGAMTDHARRELKVRLVQPISAPVYVVGISMGGMVALDWLHRFPDELQGVVLINSSTGTQPFWWRLRPRAWLTMLSALLLPLKQREAWVLRKVSNTVQDYQQHLCQWLLIQRQHPVTRASIITMLIAAARFTPRITPAKKGLILTSSADRLVSVNASKCLAQEFHWPLVTHSSAGHDLPLDDAHWVATQIAQWLNEGR